MKINKSKFKSVFLCFLILSSIILSSELWLPNGHSFFVATEINEDENLKSYFFMPKRILASPEGNRFNSIHAFYVDETLTALNDIIKRATSNNYIISPLNYDIIHNRGIFLEYALPLPRDVFSSYFGGVFLEYITSIFLVPSTQNSTSINIYIFDSVNNIIKSIYHTNAESHALIVNNITPNTENLYYASSHLMGFNLPSNNFLLRWQDDFKLPNLEILKVSGLINVFELVQGFFENPAEVFSDYDGNGTYRFANTESVLTFGEVLSYTNHVNRRASEGEVDVLSNFNRAKNFLKVENFNLILTDFTHYEETSTFYFRKIIGGFKIYEQEPFAKVIVESGVVTYYTRQMAFMLSEELTLTTLDAINFIDNVGSENNISFGYKGNIPKWIVLEG